MTSDPVKRPERGRKSSANYLLDDDRFGSGWFSALHGLVELPKVLIVIKKILKAVLH